MPSEQIRTVLKGTAELFWDLSLLLAVFIYTYAEKFYRLFVPRDLKSLQGEIILITGSGNGIGREIVLQLADKGATLVCWDVEPLANNSVVAEIKLQGSKAYGYTVDISERENIVKAAALVRSEVGDVTMVINNAGIVAIGKFLSADESLFEKMYRINILSHQWILRQFLPAMIAARKGHIVTTASVAAYVPAKEIAVYASTKHAVQGFVDSLRQEINEMESKPDIQFSTAYPSFVRTRMMNGIELIPKYDFAGKELSPSAVASQIIAGFRRNYEHIFVPGQMSIMPLFSCLPQRIQTQLQQGLFEIKLNKNKTSKK